MNTVSIQQSPFRRRRASTWVVRGLLLVCAAVLGSGCDVHSATAPGTLATIVVSPQVSLFPLATLQMSAVGYDAEGKEVEITPVWSVIAGGGSITTTGLYTAGTTPGDGVATIEASAGGLSATAPVTVLVGPPATLAVAPPSLTLVVGASQQLSVIGRDVGGNQVGVTPVWSVVAGGGTITAGGIFTAGSTPGSFINTIQVTAGGLTAFASANVSAGALATITISPNPATVAAGGIQQFTAIARDAFGNILTATPAWSVVGGGGTITSTGLFTADVVPGTYTNTIAATVGFLTGRATVVVSTGTLATITVTPNPVSMSMGTSQPFTAVGRDAAGNIVPINPAWSIASSGSGASITFDGTYTSGFIGGVYSNEVIATSGAVTGYASVIVSGGLPTNSGFLGNAARFGVLAGGGVTCNIVGSVNGPGADVGSSPTTTVTGFPSPCSLTGSLVAPAIAAAGQTDLTNAIAVFQALPCTDISGIDLSNFGPLNPLAPGCYSFTTSAATLNGALALRGSGSSQWTFRVTSTLDVGAAADVLLTGGAIPDNVHWVVGTTATLGAGSHLQGNILAAANIILQNNATLVGRALAQTGTVTMTSAVITKP